MVGWLFPFARYFVDHAGGTLSGQWRRQEDVVDTHALVEAKAHLPVIPPTKQFFRLLEHAEGVGESHFLQMDEGGPFRFRHQILAYPGGGIMYIAVFWCNVVVTQQRQFGVLQLLLRQPLM